ncbi:MAG: ABC transporter ATP-binding protein, partial [Nitriliruptoraceae bacterium]
MSPGAIDVHGLTKHYGSTVALDGLDLEMARGTIFGFLGPNGSGKTTAMRTLVGLTRPTSGTVQVLGFDAVTRGLDVRRRIGYLAQLPRFHDDLSPRRTLWFARRFFPMPDVDAARREVEEALDLVGLR